MKFADQELSLASYPANAPTDGSAQAVLTNRRFVWRTGGQEEHYPLDKISCVASGYQRAAHRALWAALLIMLAIAIGATLVWAQVDLPNKVESMVQGLSDRETPERIASARRAYQQRVDAVMLMILPLWGIASGLLVYGLWLAYSGIRGETRVQVTLFAVTRSLSRRGRDSQLLEFGERLGQQFGAVAASGIGSNPAPVTQLRKEPIEIRDFIPRLE